MEDGYHNLWGYHYDILFILCRFTPVIIFCIYVATIAMKKEGFKNKQIKRRIKQ